MPQVNGDCSYNRTNKHCSCSLVDLTNIMSIVSCIQASSLAFEGGSFIDTEEYALYNVEMEQVLAMIRTPLTKVVFVNVIISEDFFFTFIKWVYKVPIRVLAFENTTFVGKSNWQFTSGSPPHISSLQFINVPSYPLFDRISDFTGLKNWIVKLEEFTMTMSHLKSIPCNVTQQFDVLTFLDLSENLLQDNSIVTSFCQGAFPRLKTLKLRQNRLVNYDLVCQALKKQTQLRQLDLSQNNFSSTSPSPCDWQPSLVLLNLSRTGFEEINYILPNNCEILDLSYNKLHTVNISLPKLKELYLSHNMLSTISAIGDLPSLLVLAIDGNPIKTLQRGHLQYFRHLTSLRADNIPYTCSCFLVHEIKEITESGLTVQHWPDGYICESPILLRGKLISEVNLSFFECHKPLLPVVICIVILLVCFATVICIFKIHRRNKTRSRQLQTENISSVQFQS
ncbi:monocyte differentiation antigen CD14 [Rhinophrynus dorsalis]